MANEQNTDLTSFLRLRKYIGIFGLTMPIQILIMVGFQKSISYSYYTAFHDLFILNISVIGLFLFCDKGYDVIDTICNRIAGVAAILVALNPCESTEKILGTAQSNIHYTAAGVLFITLGCISLFLFNMSDGSPTDMKHKRNAVYRICGSVILASVVVIVFLSKAGCPIFIPESVCLVAFGFAWFVKGETILQDAA
jgi:hypothetical protein